MSCQPPQKDLKTAPMSLTPRKSVELFVEPLEARIAPTALITNPISNTGKSSTFYIDYTHPPKAGGIQFVSGATYGVHGSNVYALKLTGTGTVVKSGSATAGNGADKLYKCSHDWPHMLLTKCAGIGPSAPISAAG